VAADHQVAVGERGERQDVTVVGRHGSRAASRSRLEVPPGDVLSVPIACPVDPGSTRGHCSHWFSAKGATNRKGGWMTTVSSGSHGFREHPGLLVPGSVPDAGTAAEAKSGGLVERPHREHSIHSDVVSPLPLRTWVRVARGLTVVGRSVRLHIGGRRRPGDRRCRGERSCSTDWSRERRLVVSPWTWPRARLRRR
jgi:hypothetical protein